LFEPPLRWMLTHSLRNPSVLAETYFLFHFKSLLTKSVFTKPLADQFLNFYIHMQTFAGKIQTLAGHFCSAGLCPCLRSAAASATMSCDLKNNAITFVDGSLSWCAVSFDALYKNLHMNRATLNCLKQWAICRATMNSIKFVKCLDNLLSEHRSS